MFRWFYTCTLALVTLVAAATLDAQIPRGQGRNVGGTSGHDGPIAGGTVAQTHTAEVLKGSISGSLSSYFTSLLGGQGIAVSSSSYTSDGFRVTGGFANEESDQAVVATRSSVEVDGNQVHLTLQDIQLEANSESAFVSAEVILNGVDDGRLAVLQLISVDSVSWKKLTRHKEDVTLEDIRFTINPEYAAAFQFLFQLPEFDATQVLGSINLTVRFRHSN